MINEWNIQSRAHTCESCGKDFGDQQPYHTLLFDEKQDYKRLDVCEYCWQTQFAEGARERKGFISYWQGTYEAPPPPEAEAIQRETAESLLRKIIELNDPKYIPASYILAVMLERKRLLKVKEQIRSDDHRVFIYEQPKTGDVFTIVDPDLHLDQLDQVQRDVADLLEHGLPTEETEPGTEAQTEAPQSGQSPVEADPNSASTESGVDGVPAMEAAETSENMERENHLN